MGREVRHVPESWEHPKYQQGGESGHYRPLLDSNFREAHADWVLGKNKWDAGLVFAWHEVFHSMKISACGETWRGSTRRSSNGTAASFTRDSNHEQRTF